MVFVIRKKGTDLFDGGSGTDAAPEYGPLDLAHRYDADEGITKEDLADNEEAVEILYTVGNLVELPSASKSTASA